MLKFKEKFKKICRRLYKGIYNERVLIECFKTKHDAFICLDMLLTDLKIPYIMFKDTMYIDYKKAYIIVDLRLESEEYGSSYDLYLDDDDILAIVSSLGNNKKKAFNTIFKKKECRKWRKGK